MYRFTLSDVFDGREIQFPLDANGCRKWDDECVIEIGVCPEKSLLNPDTNTKLFRTNKFYFGTELKRFAIPN